MFIRREAEGQFPADRLETVLSAIFHCVFWSACYHGMNPNNAVRYINEAEVTKPRKWKEKTPEERQKIAVAEDRKMFAAISHKFKQR